MNMHTGALGRAPETSSTVCRHCGQNAFGHEFCCQGCKAAYAIIQGFGLGQYYARRELDLTARALKPEPSARGDLARFIGTDDSLRHTLHLAVDGLQCGACVWLIESVLARQPDLLGGRVNMTSRRLALSWRGDIARAAHFCAVVEQLGYRLVPFDPACLAAASDRTGHALTRALAVAGFAAGNVMLISLATWFGLTQNMGVATRGLLHWVSALIAMPAVAYAGMPFFRSAIVALRHGRSNMDVPISVGVILVTALSLWQTAAGGENTYFDSAVTLLFFLLIGRKLDHLARGRATATAEQLLLLRGAEVAVLDPDGNVNRVQQDKVKIGDRVLVAMGERVGVDGVIARGAALMDASLVTGESLPVRMEAGTAVFAGTLNLGEAVILRATATGGGTLLAECVRLIEAASQARGQYVILADRVARYYAPLIHAIALTTFFGWYFYLARPLAASLITAASVLIITCPCALALAVPAVQVLATGRLFRAGILLKSATALERLAQVDCVVFDKTGTLTHPVLGVAGCDDRAALLLAASLAANSRHPLCRALVLEAGAVAQAADVIELPGQGLLAGTVRLGSRAFCELPPSVAAQGPELCLSRPGTAPVIFRFEEILRPEAVEVVRQLQECGMGVEILSGDQPEPVARAAAMLGIARYQAAQTPPAKLRHVEALRAAGKHVLMVGDGLNDGPCLAAADVSASPSSAADISQNVADIVYQGDGLGSVALMPRLARHAQLLMRQNLALSLGYNAVMVPLAICGFITPWFAAAAMSASSLLVMANSFRIQGARA